MKPDGFMSPLVDEIAEFLHGVQHNQFEPGSTGGSLFSSLV
jgi:hypothetical protein